MCKFVYFYINEALSKVNLQCSVTSCVICITNKVEYLVKEQSCENVTNWKLYIVILNDLCMQHIVGRKSCVGTLTMTKTQ